MYHIIAHLIYDEKKVTKTQYKISSRPKQEGAALFVSNEQYIIYLIRLPYYTIWVLGNDNNIVISSSRYYFHIFLIFTTRTHKRGFAVAYINNDYTRENNIVVIPIPNRHGSVNLSLRIGLCPLHRTLLNMA